MRWLITGGCGFIGTNLIKHLLAEGGHTIRVIDNLSVGSRQDLENVCASFIELSGNDLENSSLNDRSASSPNVELVAIDILDEQLASKASQNMDIIVHLAANTGVEPSVKNPRADCLVNVIGTLNYLEAARHNRIKRFVFASSGAPVGECIPPIHEEIAPHPVSPYGASKLAGEGYCSAYFRTFGIETVALRFSNVYGPGSKHKSSVIAKFIKQAMDGKTLEVYGDGKQTRDFIYIDDLIQAIYLAATVHGIGGEVFQVATNTETTVQETLSKLLPILEKRGISAPEVDYSAPRVGDVRRNFSDTSKARHHLGWQASVGLEEGLTCSIEWFLEKG